MNFKFWKHKKEGHVIKDQCLKKLPVAHKYNYAITDEEPTHYYDDSTNLITGIAIGEMLADDSNSTQSENDTPQFEGFGGGDFGGGGSSSSYDDSNSSSNSSDSQSYDSSSSDSSSSYNSGSSSSDSGVGGDW